MQLESTQQLLELDQMYGYSRKLMEWVPLKEITSIKEVNFYKRTEIRGVGFNGESLYFQLTDDLLEKLKEQNKIIFNGEIIKRTK